MTTRSYSCLESNEELPSFENVAIHPLSISKEKSSIDSDSHPPRDPRAKCWKPVTLHLVPLILVTVFTGSLVAVLAYLLSLNEAQGGLAFALVNQGFSALTTFAYTYLPTMLSVTLSMLWNWIDLDIKRLEPFYQLSQPGGATAAHSLLLSYPHDFVAWAPVKAFKRRHWGVVVGGLATVIIFWGITPFQAAIFDTRIIAKSTAVTISVESSLESIKRSQINETLNNAFLEDVWNIMWHDAELPRFTTREGALLPLKASNRPGHPDAFVKVNTTQFTTTLDCVPAISNVSKGVITVDNGRGCQFSTQLNPDGQTLLYFGYGDNPRVDWSLEAMGCSHESVLNSFVAIVSNSGTSGLNTTLRNDTLSQFCTPTYWAQDVQASIAWPSMAVNSTTPVGTARALSADALNTSLFEYIISTAQVPSYEPKFMDSLGAPAANTIAAWSQLGDFKLDSILYISPLTGFILGASKINATHFDTLLEPASLTSALRTAHQFLFAVGISAMLKGSTNSTIPPDKISGVMTDYVNALIVVEPFAYAVQALMMLVALCSTFLALYYWQRSSHLVSDPDNLRRIGKIPVNTTSAALEQLMDDTSEARFMMQQDTGRHKLVQLCPVSTSHSGSVNFSSERNGPVAYQPTRPFYLRSTMGVGFVLSLVAITSALLALRQQSIVNQGLALPWGSSIVQQVVLSYLPTLVATLLEPFWTLLNRILCLLQPFEELRHGHARGSVSIDACYVSLPPQLTFIRAFRARHFLLATVGFVAISANVLAVGMSALFVQNDTPFVKNTTLLHTKTPSFANTSVIGELSNKGSAGTISVPFQDHFYLANMNWSSNAPLPPWTDKDHMLLPLHQDGIDSSIVYNVQSLGFSVTTDCYDLGTPSDNGLFQFEPHMSRGTPYQGYAKIMFNVSLTLNNTSTPNETCSLRSGFIAPTNGSTAFESVIRFDDSSPGCGETFFAMYIRNWKLAEFYDSIEANGSVSQDWPPFNYETFGGTSQTFMACRTGLRAAKYSTRVLGSGAIVESTPISSPTADLADNYFRSNSSDLHYAIVKINVANLALSPLGYGDFTLGHRSATSTQWFPYLMSLAANSTSTLDPSKPAPSAAELAPLIQAVNARLGALLLSSQRDKIFANSNDPKSQVDATYYDIVPRLYFNSVMFPLTIALLVFNILVAIAFYLRAPQKLLPEMPTTIYAQIKMFIGSSVTAEAGPEHERERYGYGRYLGLDGQMHVGVERAPFVHPM